MAAVRILVRGRVQGVGFRFRTASEAQRLGVTGSVVNVPDGTVEVTAFGPRESVDALATWLTGPSAPGWVDNVEVTRLPDDRSTPSSFTMG